jgi:hypothetical protein
VLLALISVGRWAIIGWFYISIFYYLFNSFKKEQFVTSIVGLLLYLIPLELMGRVLNANPIIPYEGGKYITFLILIFCLARIKVKKGKWASFILILLLPGIIMVNLADPVKEIVFNLFGMINMALGVIIFSNIYLPKVDLKRIIVNSIYPVLVLLFYFIIKSPDLSSIDFELKANDDLTADFGSNQVSTVLGYGITLLGFLFLQRWKFTKILLLDQGILLLMILWSLLSFSRGGVVGAVLAIGGVLLMNFLSRTKQSRNKVRFGSVLVIAFSLAIGFYVGNEITGGLLLQRYQGESRGTILGSKEKDLNTLTTGRVNIFLRDMEIWSDYPVFGVGAGNARALGKEEYGNGKMAHVEVSRLLAEHGFLGLLIILMVYFYPFKILFKNKGQLKRGWMLTLLVLSLFSTLHAATRTMISPILFGLAFLNINED